MFDKKLKFASSSIDEAKNILLNKEISPKIISTNSTEPDDPNLKVSLAVYEEINKPPIPDNFTIPMQIHMKKSPSPSKRRNL